MTTPIVESIHTYPLKSAAGRSHRSWSVEPAGLAEDRLWMLADADGRFLSQRERPELATLRVSLDEEGLHLSAPGLERLPASASHGGERRPVVVWRDTVDAAVADDAANEALSRWLGARVTLVSFDRSSRRAVSRDWVEKPVPIGFADGFPVLVTSSATLEAVNDRISAGGGEPVPMDRFRPNIVVGGAEPFAEHGWSRITVGGILFALVKPCARCVITTTDQEHGTRQGKEPLATLARTQRSSDRRAPGAIFGWNAVPLGSGKIHVGDAVTIAARREPPWPIA